MTSEKCGLKEISYRIGDVRNAYGMVVVINGYRIIYYYDSSNNSNNINNIIYQTSYILLGMRSGYSTEYDQNGNIKETCYYIKNSLNGECIQYNPDGTIKKISYYINDRRNGQPHYDYWNKKVETVNY